MKVQSEALQSAMQAVSIAFRQNEKSEGVLGKVLVTIKDGKARLLASDGVVIVACDLHCDDKEESDSFIVDGVLLKMAVAGYSGNINLSRKSDKLVISSRMSKCELNTTASWDYPPALSTLPHSSGFTHVKKSALYDTISKCQETISFDVSRGPVYGMLLSANVMKVGNTVEYIIHGRSIEGARMTDVKYSGKEEIDEFDIDLFKSENMKCIITQDVCKSLCRLISAEKEDLVGVARVERSMVFKCSNFYISCPTLEGVFPDLTRVIDTPASYKITIPRKEFGDSVSKSNRMLDADPRVYIECDGGLLTMSIKTDKVSFTDNLVCKSSEGKVRAAISCHYLDNAISSLTKACDEVDILFCGTQNGEATGPIMIKSKSYPEFVRVIMPSRRT